MVGAGVVKADCVEKVSRDLEEVRKPCSHLGKKCSRQREQPVWKPGGKNVPVCSGTGVEASVSR